MKQQQAHDWIDSISVQGKYIKKDKYICRIHGVRRAGRQRQRAGEKGDGRAVAIQVRQTFTVAGDAAKANNCRACARYSPS